MAQISWNNGSRTNWEELIAERELNNPELKNVWPVEITSNKRIHRLFLNNDDKFWGENAISMKKWYDIYTIINNMNHSYYSVDQIRTILNMVADLLDDHGILCSIMDIPSYITLNEDETNHSISELNRYGFLTDNSQNFRMNYRNGYFSLQVPYVTGYIPAEFYSKIEYLFNNNESYTKNIAIFCFDNDNRYDLIGTNANRELNRPGTTVNEGMIIPVTLQMQSESIIDISQFKEHIINCNNDFEKEQDLIFTFCWLDEGNRLLKLGNDNINHHITEGIKNNEWLYIKIPALFHNENFPKKFWKSILNIFKTINET